MATFWRSPLPCAQIGSFHHSMLPSYFISDLLYGFSFLISRRLTVASETDSFLGSLRGEPKSVKNPLFSNAIRDRTPCLEGPPPEIAAFFLSREFEEARLSFFSRHSRSLAHAFFFNFHAIF